MIVLVINSGSSSVKYRLFHMPSESLLSSGGVESIGIGETGKAKMVVKNGSGVIEFEGKFVCRDHAEAVKRIFKNLVLSEQADLSNICEIDAVCHRVVHGGDRFSEPVLITGEVLSALEEISELAPLHIPINLMCIRASMQELPDTQMAACFLRA